MNTSRPNTATDDTQTAALPTTPPTTKPQVSRTIQTRETIAAEGGEAGTPNQPTPLPPETQDRVYDLFHEVVRYIPKHHRIGWYHALARRYATPLTSQPTQAETAYLTWSAQRHTNPRTQASR